jgi:2-dehydropantoate 2-reductase
MYRDLMGGRPTEGDQIIGDLWRRGQGAALATPLLAACDVQLAAYERRRASSGGRA